MAQTAFIKLVPASNKQCITLDEVKELFTYYKAITTKTGKQLDWQYEGAAFPYILKETEEGKGKWFYLKCSNDQRYNLIAVGVSEKHEQPAYIQITLPDGATFGDKGKANEFCKFLGKKLQGELQLFNGRIMYFYKR
ncbi:DUF1885 family protein [Bacillus sp. HMF5848]|uniref:DUF1885 family protein n=1 Tax=Bacillus sp. HMF5848 TaxID=2495421 RepID=UPI000F790365|nr:DUF1885 family protein [Bacillus sp. HMF5848]RSK26875.1 DUF1885 family protein [Bacillus sp. HMF5848]